MIRRPTIIDVALAAQVSKSTVSLVLQDSPLVRSETRIQVKLAMERIGYVYNRAAANMRKSNTGLIGLVINDLRNPFFTEFATSVQMALSQRGYAAVMANTDEDSAVQAQVVAAMIEHGVAGLVISPCYDDPAATFDRLERAGIPTLQVLRRVAPTGPFPFAAPDYPGGSLQAARHLLDSGARHIAFVGGVAGQGVAAERMSGYLTALAATGMQPLIFAGRASRQFGGETARQIAAAHPAVDAIICFNDLVALGMLSGFAEIGHRVGPDLRLVGFDDIEECAQVFPALTSVRCDIAGFGRSVAATLLDWLENGVQPPPETRTPTELVIRASSGSVA